MALLTIHNCSDKILVKCHEQAIGTLERYELRPKTYRGPKEQQYYQDLKDSVTETTKEMEKRGLL